MTVTTKGFQGTVSDADMATQFPQLASVVSTPADLLVSAVAGARQVSVAAGTGVGHFVKYASDQAQVLSLAPPASGGKWYAIAIDREWSPTNTATLVAVDTGVTTDGTDQTTIAALLTQGGASPSTLSWLKTNPGTAGSTAAYGHHQVLAFVHVRAASTTLQVVDVRQIAGPTLTLPNLHALAWLAQLGGAGRATRVAVGPHSLGEQVQAIEAVGNGFGAFVLTGTVLVGAPFTRAVGMTALRTQINGYVAVSRIYGLNASSGRTGLAVLDTQLGWEYQWAGTDWALMAGLAGVGTDQSVAIVDSNYVQEWAGGFVTRVSRMGNTVKLKFHKRVINAQLPWNVVAFTLPPGFRPVDTVTFVATLFDLRNGDGWGGPVGNFVVNSDGTVTIQGAPLSGVSVARTGTGLFGTVTFDAA